MSTYLERKTFSRSVGRSVSGVNCPCLSPAGIRLSNLRIAQNRNKPHFKQILPPW
ncbi:hypothetical protein Pcar_3430 [Syntrophotalea carbinolica DSM 2380]|uniref:Uncharacterized protein n=1 Tax=Syntrophotalea carbinolica (strain DSM 2380 / NBRC 103641 / GraBd1) TaxID=338963 RepID=J9U9X6_SYNC1|nr:hypothetical protein Pcar_3430 [Syntrophotalea carbinolica DSM 2380]